MADATPRLAISFTQPPTAAPDWEDVTAYLEAFTLRRGRTSPLEQFGAGTLTITLDNLDRRFDPRHAAGPYYGNLKATRRVRLQAAWDGGTDDLMHAYVDAWPQRRVGYGNQFVEVPCTDAVKVFVGAKLNQSFPAQSTSDRFDAVLDAANWVTGQAWVLGDATFGVLGTSTTLGPVGDRAIDAGVAACQAATLQDVPAWTHLQAVADTELGRAFVARTGGVTFHNRTRLLLGGTGSLATFGDDLAGGEIPYADITLRDQDEATIFNDVRVTPDGLAEQVATDAASQADHFVRTLPRASLTPNEGDALGVATYLLNRFKAGASWVVGLRLNPYAPGGAVWPHLITRDLGDVVTVRYTPLGGGDRVEQVSQIEGISITWQAEGNQWAGEWALSPVDPLAGTYWILGRAALGAAVLAL